MVGQLKFSIVVPSYNQGRYIKETIDSILEQDYRPIEILVMDGGSSDETVNVLESYGDIPELKWISEPDDGVVDAVNKGFKELTGDIVGIQSSDDFYLPGAFLKVAQHFLESPEINLIFGDAEYMDEKSKVFGRNRAGGYSLNNFLSRRTSITQSSAFFRSTVLQCNSGWNNKYSYVADNELWLRICVSDGVKKIDNMLSRYRFHPEQRDAEKERIMSDWRSMIADSQDVRKLSFSSKMASRCGIYRTFLSCTDETKWLRRTWYSYIALSLYPPIYAGLDKRDLMFGYRPIRSVLSRIKQKLIPILSSNSML